MANLTRHTIFIWVQSNCVSFALDTFFDLYLKCSIKNINQVFYASTNNSEELEAKLKSNISKEVGGVEDE